jgi:hypothetical protein
LYLLAAQKLLETDTRPDAPRAVAGGMFWHIRDRNRSGDMLLDDDGQEAIAQAREHLRRYVRLAREGDFAVAPRKRVEGKCVHYCEFSRLCRVSVTNRWKA